MGQYALDIKRHQSPRAVYLRCLLSFMLSPFWCFFAHTLPVCRHCLIIICSLCVSVSAHWAIVPVETGKSIHKSPRKVQFPHIHCTFSACHISCRNIENSGGFSHTPHAFPAQPNPLGRYFRRTWCFIFLLLVWLLLPSKQHQRLSPVDESTCGQATTTLKDTDVCCCLILH